ncbi:FMN-dependent NADH-azoreductase [Mycoplasmopsis gallopavonis]|uniref:FMN-dependent NADH-azoreductase n=1 Tax=Mycoplasmopsis gallopavonis TaxID=76629 RepID=A0A449AYP3_9BACT|nr:FMN-dependent NADH-azoreductase [Mycoplasmopsis gallopavonis]RIV16746.1 FMN-dependent NADH-azoreductase [Mycoplasmopsis gallopavonis]VEU72566.1 FMN-dependent NADH-azoreductase [Mycoplasmopsis gallopavonis]
MKQVLLLNGSISNNSSSKSQIILDYFLEKLKEQKPNLKLESYDLNKTHSRALLHSNNINNFYQVLKSDKWIKKLREVDTLILVSSEVNFSPAPVVRNFIDSILVAKETFNYSQNLNDENKGNLNHLNVILITSRGSQPDWYKWSRSVSWLENVWKFLRAKQVFKLEITGTNLPTIKNLNKEEFINLYKKDIAKLIEKIQGE